MPRYCTKHQQNYTGDVCFLCKVAAEKSIEYLKSKSKEEPITLKNEPTRFEVIDSTKDGEGRTLVKYDVNIELQYQDDGRTLKVFLTNHKTMTPTPPDKDELDEILDDLVEGCDCRIDEGQAYLHMSEFAADEAKQAINRLIAKARLDEVERISKYAGAWMNPATGERTSNWVNMEVIRSRLATLEQSLKEVER